MRNKTLKSILIKDLKIDDLLVDERDSDFHLKIASLPHNDRKDLISQLRQYKKDKSNDHTKEGVLGEKTRLTKDISIDKTKVIDGYCVRFNAHLGQNGSIISPYSFTITCSEIPYAVITHNKKLRIRSLDIKELEALQGFPENHTKKYLDQEGKEQELSLNKRREAVGDAVTSTVGKHVIERMLPQGGRIVSLFSGVNGTGCLIPDNCKTIAYCELIPERLGVIKYSNKDKEGIKYLSDVKKICDKTLDPFDLLVATHPCQSFSKAGIKGGFDVDNGDLVHDVFRILKDYSPDQFVCENVVGITESKYGTTYALLKKYSDASDDSNTSSEIKENIKRKVKAKFKLTDDAFDGMLTLAIEKNFQDDSFLSYIKKNIEDLGYSFEWEILNSRDFGVPQNRNRVFYWGKKIKSYEDI